MNSDGIKIVDNRGSVATRVIASNKATSLTSTLVVVAAVIASAASAVAVIITRPTHLSGSMLVATDGNVVQTAVATTPVPLYLAPVIPMEAISKVKAIDVEYAVGSPLNAAVRAHLEVVEARQINTTFAEFITGTPGRSIAMLNGEAFILDNAPGGLTGFLSASTTLELAAYGNMKTYEVCAADVSCSAFSVSAEEAQDAFVRADTALAAAGFATESSRRRLQGSVTTDYTLPPDHISPGFPVCNCFVQPCLCVPSKPNSPTGCTKGQHAIGNGKGGSVSGSATSLGGSGYSYYNPGGPDKAAPPPPPHGGLAPPPKADTTKG